MLPLSHHPPIPLLLRIKSFSRHWCVGRSGHIRLSGWSWVERGGDGQLFAFVNPNVHFTWLYPCWMFSPCPPQSSMPAIMTMLADHAARQLLDFNQKLDINLLDNVVNCLYHGVGPQVSKIFLKKKCKDQIHWSIRHLLFYKIFLFFWNSIKNPENKCHCFCKNIKQ